MVESGLGQNTSKCYGSSENEKLFLAGEEQGTPYRRGDIWIEWKE